MRGWRRQGLATIHEPREYRRRQRAQPKPQGDLLPEHGELGVFPNLPGTGQVRLGAYRAQPKCPRFLQILAEVDTIRKEAGALVPAQDRALVSLQDRRLTTRSNPCCN